MCQIENTPAEARVVVLPLCVVHATVVVGGSVLTAGINVCCGPEQEGDGGYY